MELLIIRGLPGSGKSTMAKQYAEQEYLHIEADQFFINEHGEYDFVPEMLPVAHLYCQAGVHTALAQGKSAVVANTFSRYWEMTPYFEIAKIYGVRVRVITCKGSYPNIHGVPEEIIQKMRDRWED